MINLSIAWNIDLISFGMSKGWWIQSLITTVQQHLGTGNWFSPYQSASQVMDRGYKYFVALPKCITLCVCLI